MAERINQDLLGLKKVWLMLPGWQALSPQTADKSRKRLVEVLATLANCLEARVNGQVLGEVVVPYSLLLQLQRDHPADLAHYVAQLRDAVGSTSMSALPFCYEDLTLLEQIAATADADAATLFRSLMRR